MITIEKEWINYRKVYGREPLSPIQEKELKQTFYAGFWMCLISIGDAALGQTEKEAMETISRLEKEARMFLTPING